MTDEPPPQPRSALPVPQPRPVEADFLPVSPRWGVLTKFLISMVFLVLAGAVLVRFRQMIAPLVLAVILAYLLRPVVERMVTNSRLSWGAAAAILYAMLLIVVFAVLTLTGIALIQQIQGLYGVVLQITSDLPGQLEHIIAAPLQTPFGPIELGKPFSLGPFGPFTLPLATGDWGPLYDQVVSAIQPALSRTGVLVSSLATTTAETLGWLLFILVISFYLLNDSRNIALSIEGFVPAAYVYDARRLVSALGPIWNAFLRGQITLAIAMGVVVSLVMTLLGVRYSVVLGLMAGLLEFIPLAGPIISGTVAVLVALFQPGNWLGLNPLNYAILILVVAIVLQQIESHIMAPRILGGSLNLHPVVVLIGAVVAANLAGVVGLLLSAPTLATLKLFGRYIYRKMFDLDPWPDPPPMPRAAVEIKWMRLLRRRVTMLWPRR